MTSLINNGPSLIQAKIKPLIFVKNLLVCQKKIGKGELTDLVKILLEKPEPGLVRGGDDGPGQAAGVLSPDLRGHGLVPPQPRGRHPLCQAQS